MSARAGVLLVALVSVAASVARTAAGGQDLNFDLITYHFYLGYSAFHDRFALDFLPASIQGYQSPLPYAGLYLLDRLGAPPLANAVLHAGVHALNLVVLYLLARLLLARTPAEDDRGLLAGLWLLGAVTPLYWQLVGTSFGDLPTSVLVLAGLWLVARDLAPGGVTRGFVLGAALLGAAVALRMHNAIYAVALGGALLCVRFAPWRERARALGVFAAASGGAWLVLFAPWAWRVQREFGNPIFPFYNGVFGSPDFPAVNLALTSFVPSSLVEALTLPLRIATQDDWVYAEKSLADVRPALLMLAALACAGAWAWRRHHARLPAGPTPPARRLVMAFFLIAVPLWAATSANGRYGVALFLLAGPVCGALLASLLPRRHVLLVVAAVLLWQAALHQLFFVQYRWPSGPWGARYFDWELPASHPREPALYLSFGFQTASTLAPRLHPQSRHASLVGQYSPDVDHPGARRLRQMIDAPPGRIYGAFDFYYTQQPEPATRSIKSYFAGHLRRWGLDFTAEPCSLVPLRRPPGEGEWRGAPPEYILCELRPAAAAERDAALAEYRDFTRKLAPLAAACPQLLRAPLSIVRVHGQWQVASLASFETQLHFLDAGPFLLQQMRPPFTALALGAVTAQGIRALEPDCTKWLARLRR